MAKPETDEVTDATRATEQEEATLKAGADRMPTPDEEAAAEKNELDPEVAKNYEEQAKRGANVKGEGQI